MNFARRSDCFGCKLPKGSKVDQSQKNPQQNSNRPQAPILVDWNCEVCGKHNFARRTDCFGCKRPKGTKNDQSQQWNEQRPAPRPQFNQQNNPRPQFNQQNNPRPQFNQQNPPWGGIRPQRDALT